MKKIIILLVIVASTIPLASNACSGTWHTCDNLFEFMYQSTQNCAPGSSFVIIDCDAGRINFNVAMQ